MYRIIIVEDASYLYKSKGQESVICLFSEHEITPAREAYEVLEVETEKECEELLIAPISYKVSNTLSFITPENRSAFVIVNMEK